MIDTYKGEKFVMCDECGTEMKDKRGNTARFDPKDFDILVEAIRDNGWKAFKEGNVWNHNCPDCQ